MLDHDQTARLTAEERLSQVASLLAEAILRQHKKLAHWEKIPENPQNLRRQALRFLTK
jgi:hypothetical protein